MWCEDSANQKAHGMGVQIMVAGAPRDKLLVPQSAPKVVSYTASAGGCRTEEGGLGDYSVQNGLDQAGCQNACTSDLACVAYEYSLVTSGTRCEVHTRAISYGSGQGKATCYVKES